MATSKIDRQARHTFYEDDREAIEKKLTTVAHPAQTMPVNAVTACVNLAARVERLESELPAKREEKRSCACKSERRDHERKR